MTRTTVVHCKHEPCQVYIGRPSKWGNPYIIGPDGTREEVIEKFRKYFFKRPDLMQAAKEELVGKKLGCFCSPNACHGDIIAKFINGLYSGR